MIKGKFLIPALVGVMTISSLGMTTLAADTTTTTKNSISDKKAEREAIKLELDNMTPEERKAYLEDKHQEREDLKGTKPNNGKLRKKHDQEGRPQEGKLKDGKLKDGKHFNGLSAEEISAFKDMSEEEKKAYLAEKHAEKLEAREKFESMTDEEKEAYLATKKLECEKKFADFENMTPEEKQALLAEKHNKKPVGGKQLPNKGI